MRDRRLHQLFGVPEGLPQRPWCWRNCRDAGISVHAHLLPPSWRLRAWWEPETYSLAAGVHLGCLSIQLWCDIGNTEDPTWRGRLALSFAEAWERAGRK
jgi:hypothetical protein